MDKSEREALRSQGLKRCFACKRILPASDFNKNRALRGGLSTYCRECTRPIVRRSQDAYRARNRKRLLSERRTAYAADPEKYRDSVRRAYYKHHEQRLADRRAYYWAHRAAQLAYSSRWTKAHPDRNRHWAKLAKIRRKGAIGTHTLVEWREKCELFANLCAYCGKGRPLHREHKIPLSRGGTNYIENIVPACLPCNLKKGTRTAKEFLALTA